MKNTSRTPYIYKVTNLETGQYYIGSQCSGKTIGVNYFTSSTNKAFKDGFKTYGEEKYKIEIIKEFEDPEECVRVENYMIRDHMLLKDGLCVNRFYCCGGKKIFSTLGTHHTGRNKGFHHSEETRKKMSITKKRQNKIRKQQGLPSPNTGVPLSEERRRKISLTKKGTHLSDETRKKMSLSQQGIPSPNRIKISIEGNVFNSITEASKHYNVCTRVIRYWDGNKKGHPSPGRIKISIDDTTFDSLTEASKYYNVHKSTIRNWVKNNKHNAFLIEK